MNKFEDLLKTSDNITSLVDKNKQVEIAKTSLGEMHDKLTSLIQKQEESDRFAQLAKYNQEIDKRANQGKYNKIL